MPKCKYLLWTDLEATGSKTEDPIIEWAWIITERAAPFDELSHGSLVINPTLDGGQTLDDLFAKMVPVVQEMHTVNGLWADLKAGKGVSMIDAQEAIISHLTMAGGHHEFMLAGSGVSHYDRRLVELQAPLVAKWLQYPNFDVGVVRRFFDGLEGGDAFVNEAYGSNIAATGGTKHRAMDDIRDHLNESRVYSQFLQQALNGRQVFGL